MNQQLDGRFYRPTEHRDRDKNTKVMEIRLYLHEKLPRCHYFCFCELTARINNIISYSTSAHLFVIRGKRKRGKIVLKTRLYFEFKRIEELIHIYELYT